MFSIQGPRILEKYFAISVLGEHVQFFFGKERLQQRHDSSSARCQRQSAGEHNLRLIVIVLDYLEYELLRHAIFRFKRCIGHPTGRIGLLEEVAIWLFSLFKSEYRLGVLILVENGIQRPRKNIPFLLTTL